MTDALVRERSITLSVVAIVALAFGASWWTVVGVDRAAAREAGAVAALPSPPAEGLRPAARPARRVVVVRSTRAS